MASRNPLLGRPTQGPNPLVSDRQTTIIDPAAPADTPGQGGPPVEGLQAELAHQRELDYSKLYLADPLTDQQVRQDAPAYWSQAGTYISAVASMMKQRADLFTGSIRYRGEHLESRYGRIQVLSELIIRKESELAHLKDTLIMEFADVVRMSDAAVITVDLERQKPTLTRGERQNLDSLVTVPNELWKERQAGILKTRRAGERQKGEAQDLVEQAMASAVAERVLGKIRAGERPSDEDVLFALGYTAPPDPKAPPPRARKTPATRPATVPKRGKKGTTGGAGAMPAADNPPTPKNQRTRKR